MKGRTDVVALIAGLIACLLAGLALWASVAPVPWGRLPLAIPLVLVVVGLIGLFSSRDRTP